MKYGADGKIGKSSYITALIAAAIMLPGLQFTAFAAGTSGASFLDIPVGAGPAALGSAYSALATDAYAPVWNPAGLGSISGNELAGQHLSYLESIHYEFLSFVHPLDDARNSDVHRGLTQLLQQYDVNDYAASVKVYALKPA